jgi:hypothetical protein
MGGYHGLYIEMKRAKGGQLSPPQKEWIDRLRAEGYRVEVCAGADAAMEVITGYLAPGKDDLGPKGENR